MKIVEQTIATAHAAALEEATLAGFATIEEHEAAKAALALAAQSSEAAKAALEHRTQVCDMARGRITDEMRELLVAGGEPPTTYAINAVRAWLDGKRPILVISGGTGTGKTIAALWAACHRAKDAQFVRALRVGAHFERWSSDREDKVAPLALGVELMIVDDLGLEPLEDRRSILALEEIVDARQSRSTKTILTTNLDADALKKRYAASPRFLSRLAQGAIFQAVQGADLRRRPS